MKKSLNKISDGTVIEVHEDDVRDGQRYIANVKVMMQDGTFTRFHILARLAAGRPSLELSTSNNNGGSTRKSVIGHRRK